MLRNTNIDAKSLYQNHTMILGNSVKNFVIVIPNEAHESMHQLKKQRPLANQPYFPQHLITKVGTNIIWFNADVHHNHTVGLNDSRSQRVYQSSYFQFNDTLDPITLKNAGNFSFLEGHTNPDMPTYIMNGTNSC